MKRLLVFIVSVLAMGSAGAQVLPTRDVGWVFAESELQRFPEAWQLDHGTRLFFGYSQGVGCKAMLGLWKASGDDRFLRYVEQWTDTLIGDDGSILRYEPEAYNLDFINSGKVLFDIYRVTGNEKYRRAMDRLIHQLTNQPRTCDGGYWHKLIYPHQMWLDGIYMASPFMAQYGRTFDQPQWVDEAVRQITLCHTHTYDAATGLYHHGYDESRQQRWADDRTGCSPTFWGRSIGWWFMALVDALEFIPADHEGYERIHGYLTNLAVVLTRYQDSDGLWWQVLDEPGREGNYAEASVSTQLMYAYARGVQQGLLDDAFLPVARKAYDGICRQLMRRNDDGTLSLTHCCQVGGLGGKPYRDGSYDYYIHEKVRDDDAKATGPFILGFLELMKTE